MSDRQKLVAPLETAAAFDMESVRVKQGYAFLTVFTMTLLMVHFGYIFCAINPLIDTFIVKFGWESPET